MPLAGVIFDLDGTLVDSKLDFSAIRAEMALADGEPILEALTQMPEGARKAECRKILAKHEMEGAARATLMPGAAEFLTELDRRTLHAGIMTRNSRRATEAMLQRLDIGASHVMTRDDAPPKPDPTGLLDICRAWKCAPGEVVFVGDFLFDLQAGRNAGIRTVLYSPGELPEYADQADFVIRGFSEAAGVIDLLTA